MVARVGPMSRLPEAHPFKKRRTSQTITTIVAISNTAPATMLGAVHGSTSCNARISMIRGTIASGWGTTARRARGPRSTLTEGVAWATTGSIRSTICSSRSNSKRVHPQRRAFRLPIRRARHRSHNPSKNRLLRWPAHRVAPAILPSIVIARRAEPVSARVRSRSPHRPGSAQRPEGEPSAYWLPL